MSSLKPVISHIAISALVFALAFVASTPLSAAEHFPTTAEVTRYLDIHGPRETLKHYFDCSSGVGYDLEKQADAKGVAFVISLLPFSDACYTEGLLSELGDAMIKNPAAVLPYVSDAPNADLTPSKICLPFISGDLPHADALKVVSRAKKALSTVHAKALERAKAACLAEDNFVIGQIKSGPN